jgi:hypothetical protein
LTGTTGTGAAVSPEGRLHVAGIGAELTAHAAGSYVGAFAHSAIFIRDRIDVLIERRDASGRQRVTVWASMWPALPDPAKFWGVA